MIRLSILLLLCASTLYSEQLLRETWQYASDFTSLYRISDNRASAEFSSRFNHEGEWSPEVFILETDHIKVGSLKDQGIWKFSSLASLTDNSTLRRSHGLTADRSSENSLHRPAASLEIPGQGGIFCRGEESRVEAAVWKTLFLSPYSPLCFGGSVILPEQADPQDDLWFSQNDPPPAYPVFYAVADWKADRGSSRFHLQSSLSSSEYRIPGVTLLPVYSYFGRRWDSTSRVWYNSAYWVNRNLEQRKWVWSADSNTNLRSDSGIHAAADIRFGQQQGEQEVDEGGGIEVAFPFNQFHLTVKAEQEKQIRDSIAAVLQKTKIRLNRGGVLWRYSLEGQIAHDYKRIGEWKITGDVRRNHRTGRYSRLYLPLHAEPGTLSIKPQWEEFIRVGSYSLKVRAGYEFYHPLYTLSPAESLIIRIQFEWNHG